MLKTVAIHFLLVALATAATLPLDVTVAQESQPVAATAYQFGYNDGQSTRSESRDASGNVLGSFSYIGTDGLVRTTHYSAGADGYKIIAAPAEVTPLTTTANTATTTTTQDATGSTGLQQDTSYLTAPLTPIYGTPTILVASTAAEEQPPSVVPQYTGLRTPTTVQQTAYQPATTTIQQTAYQPQTTTAVQGTYQAPTTTQVTRYWPSPVVPPTTTGQVVKVAPIPLSSTAYQSSTGTQYVGGSPVAVNPYANYPGYQVTVPATTTTSAAQTTGYQYPTTYQYPGLRVVPVNTNYVYRYV